MQASFHIIFRNGFSMNFSIRGSSAWWLCVRMLRITALDIQVSLHNPTAMLEDSMTSVKMLYWSWNIEFALIGATLLIMYMYVDSMI